LTRAAKELRVAPENERHSDTGRFAGRLPQEFLVKVTFAADRDVEIQSIYHWFRSDRDLARSVEVAAPRGSDREAMGAVDTVAAVASTAVGLGQLAFAFAGWRQSRPAGADITITRPDGARLTVAARDALTGEALTEFLTAWSGGPPAAAKRRPRRSK
jgi:hypothetical protein